ncbi:MAG: acyl carrier protein [Rhodospirillales bacterium]|nr:acyl carrier protein [Rhodospirillales bacterium]
MSNKLDRNEILKKLNEVFCDVFEDDDIVIQEETTAEDIEDWDSLMHITLVITVEGEFDIKLKAAEVGKLVNVGALIDILQDRATS